MVSKLGAVAITIGIALQLGYLGWVAGFRGAGASTARPAPATPDSAGPSTRGPPVTLGAVRPESGTRATAGSPAARTEPSPADGVRPTPFSPEVGVTARAGRAVARRGPADPRG